MLSQLSWNGKKNNVKRLLKGNDFAWFHDGATRGVSCFAMVFRVIVRNKDTSYLEAVQVLGKLRFIPKSEDGLELAGNQLNTLNELGLPQENALYANCDACSTNIAAIGYLEEQFKHTVFALCFSHLGANTGSKITCSEVDKFFLDFIAIMNHSLPKQSEWSKITHRPFVAYGGVRWFNRYVYLFIRTD